MVGLPVLSLIFDDSPVYRWQMQCIVYPPAIIILSWVLIRWNRKFVWLVLPLALLVACSIIIPFRAEMQFAERTHSLAYPWKIIAAVFGSAIFPLFTAVIFYSSARNEMKVSSGIEKAPLRLLRAATYTWASVALFAALVALVWRTPPIDSLFEPEIDKATPSDVKFVLNRVGFGDKHVEKVDHSYRSEHRYFSDDHTQAFAFKIRGLQINELNGTDTTRGRFYRGDKNGPTVHAAVSLVTNCTTNAHISWFPSETDIFSDKIYVAIDGTWLFGRSVIGTRLTLLRLEDGEVFYADVQDAELRHMSTVTLP